MPLLSDPETRRPVSVAAFDAAFARDHPSITYRAGPPEPTPSRPSAARYAGSLEPTPSRARNVRARTGRGSGQQQGAARSVNAGREPIQIRLLSLTGNTLRLSVDPGETIAQLKERVYDCWGIPANQMYLIFSGMQLEGERTLQEYGIQNESVLHLVTKLRGD